MNHLIKFINGKNAGRKVLGLFILTNAVYVCMLTVTIPNTMEFSNGMALLDMMPKGYDLIYVSDLFKALGEMGRETYLTHQIPVDMVYPLLVALTYSLLLAYFLKRLNKLHTSLIYLCLIPIVSGIADYLENLGVIAMLKSYPELTEIAVETTSSFSLIKSITTSVFFVILIVMFIIIGIQMYKKK